MKAPHPWTHLHVHIKHGDPGEELRGVLHRVYVILLHVPLLDLLPSRVWRGGAVSLGLHHACPLPGSPALRTATYLLSDPGLDGRVEGVGVGQVKLGLACRRLRLPPLVHEALEVRHHIRQVAGLDRGGQISRPLAPHARQQLPVVPGRLDEFPGLLHQRVRRHGGGVRHRGARRGPPGRRGHRGLALLHEHHEHVCRPAPELLEGHLQGVREGPRASVAQPLRADATSPGRRRVALTPSWPGPSGRPVKMRSWLSGAMPVRSWTSRRSAATVAVPARATVRTAPSIAPPWTDTVTATCGAGAPPAPASWAIPAPRRPPFARPPSRGPCSRRKAGLPPASAPPRGVPRRRRCAAPASPPPPPPNFWRASLRRGGGGRRRWCRPRWLGAGSAGPLRPRGAVKTAQKESLQVPPKP